MPKILLYRLWKASLKLAGYHQQDAHEFLITLIEPILNPFWVFILMGEVPAWTSLAGGIVIVGAVTARQFSGARK